MPRLELLCSNQRLGQITQTQGLIIHDIMQKQNSVIVLLYIFKQFAKEDTSLQVGKSLRMLQMRSLEISQTLNLTWYLQILGYYVNFMCCCILTVCSQPIRVFPVSLVYNNQDHQLSIVWKRFGDRIWTEWKHNGVVMGNHPCF